MELNVKVDEGFYINLPSGEVKSQVRSSIPLMAPISVRKMKPSLKFAKKIGDTWIGSNKMSFALLLAYLQLKQEKNNVMGLYKHGDRYFYMEGSVDMYKQSNLTTGMTDADETPDIFLSLRGKVYDGIFGTVDVRNMEFDFLRAYSDLSRVITPAQIVALVLILSVTGYLAISFFRTPPKVPVPEIVQKAPPPPPPLTPVEASHLVGMLKDRFIQKYSEVQRDIDGSKHEKWLERVTLTSASTRDRESIAVNFKYASYYPFEGAKREGNAYSWTVPYGQSLARADLKDATPPPVAPYVCLKYLIHYPVTERSGDRWTVSLKEDKYPRIAFLLNLIYNCPCAIKELTIDDKGLSGTVILDGT